MDPEIKGFLIGLAIVCALILGIAVCSSYEDMWYASQGYEWVPPVAGHWEKR